MNYQIGELLQKDYVNENISEMQGKVREWISTTEAGDLTGQAITKTDWSLS